MQTPIVNRDLTKEAPHSPSERIGGFAILARTVDKCRAKLDGKLGEFHFDCPLDNLLFNFEGIKGDQFKSTVQAAKNYEDVADWLKKSGSKKSDQEIDAWSEQMDTMKAKDMTALKAPEKQKMLQDSCEELGLDFYTVTLFEWLDADDAHTFEAQASAR